MPHLLPARPQLYPLCTRLPAGEVVIHTTVLSCGRVHVDHAQPGHFRDGKSIDQHYAQHFQSGYAGGNQVGAEQSDGLLSGEPGGAWSTGLW